MARDCFTAFPAAVASRWNGVRFSFQRLERACMPLRETNLRSAGRLHIMVVVLYMHGFRVPGNSLFFDHSFRIIRSSAAPNEILWRLNRFCVFTLTAADSCRFYSITAVLPIFAFRSFLSVPSVIGRCVKSGHESFLRHDYIS